ncbi:hypothetical protein QR680_017509 [Steinernema hermaphroditum]|uniref:CCHC-type domain-containing protein n=1 Tax=Steinernema hermaphroditum TaxID=289476 RepID=A0AA39HEU5_9BILA|nr:hypothetical protein QR680_017509 [Steinernema hermaphroditum]
MSEHDEAASTLEEKVDSMQAIQSQLLETQSQMAVLMKRLSDQMASSQQPAAISEKPLRSSEPAGAEAELPLSTGWRKRIPRFRHVELKGQLLSAQVQLLQQQVSAGFGNLNAVSPYPRGPNQPMCFQCKGFGHYSNKCPQGPSRQ